MRVWPVLLALLIIASTSVVQAYPRTLTEEDLQASIDYGTSRKGKALVERGQPYMVSLGPLSAAVVFTPWLQIASAAQDAAAKYQPYTLDSARDTLARATGQVIVAAYVVDTLDGFWRNPHGVLLQGTAVVQPFQKRGAFHNVLSCRSQPCSSSATITLAFPDADLDSMSDATIVVVLNSGRKELRGTAKFSAMR